MNAPLDQHHRRLLLEMIPRLRRLGPAVTARDVSRRYWRLRWAAPGVLQRMVDFGLGRWEPRPPGPRGGRPTRVFIINEELLDETAGPAAGAGPPEARSP